MEFLPGQNGRSNDDDYFFELYGSFFIVYTDRGSVYRITDLDGFHSSDVKKVHHMAALLVGGIMIGYICSAITDFVVTFADDSDIVNLHGWSQEAFQE